MPNTWKPCKVGFSRGPIFKNLRLKNRNRTVTFCLCGVFTIWLNENVELEKFLIGHLCQFSKIHMPNTWKPCKVGFSRGPKKNLLQKFPEKKLFRFCSEVHLVPPNKQEFLLHPRNPPILRENMKKLGKPKVGAPRQFLSMRVRCARCHWSLAIDWCG